MSTVGQKEILTQKHVIKLFKSELGYTYLGYWKEREDNSNVEEGYRTDWLKPQGHSDNSITEVLHKLSKATAQGRRKAAPAANRHDDRTAAANRRGDEQTGTRQQNNLQVDETGRHGHKLRL